MTTTAIRHPGAARMTHAGPLDQLAAELVARWNGDGPSASALAKAERLNRGFRRQHGQVRQDRHLVAELSWGLLILFWGAVALLQSALADIVMAEGALVPRVILSGGLLVLALTCLSRAPYRLPLVAAGMAATSLAVLLVPAADPALAAWDMKAALVGWAIIAGKAGRLYVDRQIDLAEARLLLKAAGCK